MRMIGNHHHMINPRNGVWMPGRRASIHAQSKGSAQRYLDSQHSSTQRASTIYRFWHRIRLLKVNEPKVSEQHNRRPHVNDTQICRAGGNSSRTQEF
jgi:hypothetical protein